MFGPEGRNPLGQAEKSETGPTPKVAESDQAARRGEKGIRDEAITTDGRYLYALDADVGTNR
jgi:hypothetical protein